MTGQVAGIGGRLVLPEFFKLHEWGGLRAAGAHWQVNPSSAAEIDRELARMKHQRKLAEAKQKREFTNFFARKDAKEST